MGRPATGKTPVRHIRIPDDVWEPAKTHAAERGESVAAVVVRALRMYAAGAEPPAE